MTCCTDKGSPYEDVKSFCNVASIERVKTLDYVLTPGRYVGLAEEDDDFNFSERFSYLKKEFEAQIKENLAKVKIDD